MASGALGFTRSVPFVGPWLWFGANPKRRLVPHLAHLPQTMLAAVASLSTTS